MSQQEEMKLDAGGEPPVSPADVERFLAVLRDWESARPPQQEGEKPRSPGWLWATEIGAKLDASDRFVRKLAAASCPAVVSFPGSPGYKLWQLCSLEEVGHCIEAFESQGRDMFKRAILYRRAYHARFRGAPEASA